MPRHHLVPQMYLRNFADERGLLRLVDRNDLSRSIPSSVNNACNEVGFYAWRPGLRADEVDDPSMLDPGHVEGLLSVFEGRAAAVIAQILQSGQPPETLEQRYDLVHFVALQAARGRRFREDLSQTATWAARQHLRETVTVDHVRHWLTEQGLPHGRSDIQAFLDRILGPDGPRLLPDTTFAIQQALRFALIDVAPRLWTGLWRIAEFAEPALLSSDEPVVPWHPDEEPVTVLTAPVVWLPLGRRHLLEISHPSSVTTASYDQDPIGPQLVNALVATQAERWILHHPEDRDLINGTDVGVRTEWADEVLDTRVDGDLVRELRRLRRLPKK
ncbi:DUF4238 domain-containing protein [Blastococcus sp. MG754427]|uniref:DUF4238 domain-containing protein n=1 Tax=Blastococcus sp. MG754427 TaxID=2570318 RepID=UPI001F1F1A22|nr:DUF4238 domain-containing protein [Blastococcus sp. MG754427]